MHEPFLSIVGGGLVAALVTIGFNVWWDYKKQKSLEDWEFKRYEANVIHYCTNALMEAFFSAKTELYYLTSTLESLLNSLQQLGHQADAIIRQELGPNLTVAELEQRKEAALEPFKTYNQQQINIRWNQYEQKAKESHAKAEVNLVTLRPLIRQRLYEDVAELFDRLSEPFIWDLPHGNEKLQTLEDATTEILQFREDLMAEMEVKLGRRKKGS
jgi:hypothetical protein